MPITENSADRRALRSGSTTLVLDKKANTASLQRKILFWSLKLDVAVGRASGVDVCHTMLVMRGGAAWALSASDKKDAEASTAQVRGFLGLA